ncbi:MAG: rhomboid family intramembrane serine protease [Endomicrobia bacterium]|nr:rhomboid family intramembrane serine protease [Endomicrobiia bacterium]
MIPLKDNIPSYKKPLINYIIITINSLVFIYQYFFLSSYETQNFIYSFGFVPIKFITEFSHHWWNIITSMFIHGGFFHFLGNMWFLYIFGDNVEDNFGHLNFLLLYITCGIFAAIFQFILSPTSNIPMVGASGAISGILGAYFILYPYAGVLTLIPFGLFSRIIVMPAVFFLGLWIIFQILSGTQSLAIKATLGKDIGGIAYWAHIGGFLCGVILTLNKRRKRYRYRTYWRYF